MRVAPNGCFGLKLLAVFIWSTNAHAEEQRLPIITNPVSSLAARMTEAVAAKMPKYVPLALQPVKTAVSGETAGDGDASGEILYLPSITVTAGKPIPDADFAFLTPKGRLELVLKANPGLRLGLLSKLNNAVGLEIQKEEREAGKRAALKEQVLSIAVGDEARVKEEIRLMRAATARPNIDWLSKSPGSR